MTRKRRTCRACGHRFGYRTSRVGQQGYCGKTCYNLMLREVREALVPEGHCGTWDSLSGFDALTSAQLKAFVNTTTYLKIL